MNKQETSRIVSAKIRGKQKTDLIYDRNGILSPFCSIQVQALIDDVRAKEQAVNDAIISRNKDVQSAGQTIRDAQIGDGRDILDMERCELGDGGDSILGDLYKYFLTRGLDSTPVV